MSTKHKEKTENNIECTAKATITDFKTRCTCKYTLISLFLNG